MARHNELSRKESRAIGAEEEESKRIEIVTARLQKFKEKVAAVRALERPPEQNGRPHLR